MRGFTPSGGMGTATSFLALALARMGHEVEILTGENDPNRMEPNWADTYARAGIRTRPSPVLREHVEPWPFEHARRTELALAEDTPEVVIAHDFGAPVYTALGARLAGRAFADTLFVVFCHGPRRYVLDVAADLAPSDLAHVLQFGVMEQASVELADVVVSPSVFLLDWMRGEGWRLPERSYVVPYFTRSTATGEPVLTARGSDGPLERLSFFGRLDEKKGLLVFAAALNAVDAKLVEGLELEFVGRTTSTWPRERIEHLLAPATKRALASVTFETHLDQHEALARLSRPGTLVVMPSLQDNSPNAVYECLECEIPFLASRVGGVPELIAVEDRDRVLFDPTIDGIAEALGRVLRDRRMPRPARAEFSDSDPFESWADVVAQSPAPRRPRADTAVDAVRTDGPDVASALEATTAPFVLFLGENDHENETLTATLLEAQAATDADAVTCGIRDADTIRFFVGDPGGLGALGNEYGVVALVRRVALDGASPPPWPPQDDGAWALLAHLAASGKRTVSVPEALVTRATHTGTVESDPEDALLAVQELERALPRQLRGAARLTAGLAADARPFTPTARGNVGAGAVVLVLTLVAAALRFATLGRQSYWYDELVTVSLLHRSFGGLLHAIPRSEATPYVYYVLAWPWARVFGFGEAGLRSLSAFAGTLAVPVTYAAGRALVSRRVGIVSAALVTVSPFLVWYSQEARAYALFVLLAAVTLFFFSQAWNGERRSLVGWSLAAAAAVATQYFAVFVVAAEALFLLRRRPRDALVAAVLPATVLAAEVPLILKQRHNGANVTGSPLSHRVAGIPKDLLVGYSFPAELAGTAIAVVLVLVGVAFAVAAARRSDQRRALLALGIVAFALVVPIALAIAGNDYVIARNMIAIVVPAGIFLATGYTGRRSGLALAAALCVLFLAIDVSVAADKQYGRTDWRGAAHALGDASTQRAIVATPTIDAQLLHEYIHGIASPTAATLDVAEIDVLALASQGGFSTHAVHPPTTPPRPAPSGFRLASTERRPTFVLVRYRTPFARRVTTARLAALGLDVIPPAVMLQSPSR